jgi:hypothetical protein
LSPRAGALTVERAVVLAGEAALVFVSRLLLEPAPDFLFAMRFPKKKATTAAVQPLRLTRLGTRRAQVAVQVARRSIGNFTQRFAYAACQTTCRREKQLRRRAFFCPDFVS